MTAHNATGARGATHVWVPFLGTSLYVQFTDETDRVHGTARTHDPRSLLAEAVPEDALTRDDRYGVVMWRTDVERLHAVVEALWNEDDRQVRIHLDQAPRAGREDDMPGPRDG
ncbi:hypothetical protein IQ62_09270 [Streptomyces scabiei]|uniref:hypothetical protein n=1 Tax=Streptomyces scabiei TaxID=1930 RepID=UPI0004E675E9|nr:hypothetical protein [Streptomyces scabiei]KFG01089.1 hypothetical protein IQ62_09270 [Streptomyces scabiei]